MQKVVDELKAFTDEKSRVDKHIEDLKALFVYAPDTAIKEHPIKIGSGEFTAVTGVMTGTFTKPMPIGDGKFIQPTGKKFAVPTMQQPEAYIGYAAHLFDASGAIVKPDTAAYLGKFMQAFAAWVAANRRT